MYQEAPEAITAFITNHFGLDEQMQAARAAWGGIWETEGSCSSARQYGMKPSLS